MFVATPADLYDPASSSVGETRPSIQARPEHGFHHSLLDRSGVPSFVNIDTCFTPDYPYLRPYTLSKKQFIAWGESLTDNTATRFLNLVLQHPFGPGDRPGKFVPWIIQQCSSGVEVIDLTSGEQEKDFVFVADAADACLCVLRNVDQLPFGTSMFEVGRGKAVSVRRLVETIHRLSGSAAELRFGALPQRPGEVMRSVADTAALRELGWSPKFTLEQGVRATLDVGATTKTTRPVD